MGGVEGVGDGHMTWWRWWRVWVCRSPAYDCLIVATVAASVLILCTVYSGEREWCSEAVEWRDQ